MYVNSWYRPQHINQRVGGSKYSRHQYGDAVDIRSNYLAPGDIYRLLDRIHPHGGLGKYYNFVHIDWRGRQTRWNGRSSLGSIPLTDLAWAFVGFGVMCLLMGCGWSVAIDFSDRLELAEYKLAVGSILFDIKDVSDSLEKSADTLAIATEQKQEIKQLTQESKFLIQRVEQEIDREQEKLLHLEDN